MKKRKVVSRKNLPMRMPLVGTLVWWLVLDKLGAPGWVWGVLGTIIAVGWFAFVVDVFIRDDVEVLKGEEG